MTAILKTDNATSLKSLHNTAKKLGIKMRIVPDEEMEDFILGKLIEESDKDKDEGEVGDIIEFLKKNGCPL